jgi:hypothetical protein
MVNTQSARNNSNLFKTSSYSMAYVDHMQVRVLILISIYDVSTKLQQKNEENMKKIPDNA